MDFEDRDSEMYMDNAATTIISEEVVAEMMPYLEERYGNPEAHYHLGREAKEAVELAAERVARLVGCKPEHVFFTSGGSEANNWAIKGCNMTSGGCIVAGAAEHVSILEPLKWLAKSFPENYTYSLLDVDVNGMVDLKQLKAEVESGDVGLVSIQYANNETGVIQPIAEIAEICDSSDVPFHCDAVQAVGKVPIDMEDDGIDMLTVSSHKIHGPMGIGALCFDGVDIEPLIHGGPHQNGMRAGTLPVAQIVGFGKAAEMACSWKKEMKRVENIRKKIVQSLTERTGAVVHGGDNVLPSIVSFTIPGVEASAVCGVLCERHGVCISTGAACSRGEDSHVLKAIGVSDADRKSSFRISLSVTNKDTEGILVVDRLQSAIRESNEREML